VEPAIARGSAIVCPVETEQRAEDAAEAILIEVANEPTIVGNSHLAGLLGDDDG